jgi:hypothetical protein
MERQFAKASFERVVRREKGILEFVIQSLFSWLWR